MEFKPGTYKKGDLVSVEGTLWMAKRDIGYATALPKENMYWTRVEVTANIQTMIDAVPKWGRKKIGLFDDYELNQKLVIRDKSINLIGEVRATIKAPQGVLITRTWAGANALLENLLFVGNYVGDINGITVQEVTRFNNVSVVNYGGHGFAFMGNVLGEVNTNSSHSKVRDCISAQNKGSGFYMVGGDANAIKFDGCDSRDNSGVGFHDSSFLGNHFSACMAHSNKRGNYWATDNNNRAFFSGCYSEQDSPVSYFGGCARVEGGLIGEAILEKHATANIDGYELREGSNDHRLPYRLIEYRRYDRNMIKVFARKMDGKDVFQWRLYNIDGDTFYDKGDNDLPTIQEAFKEAETKIILT